MTRGFDTKLMLFLNKELREMQPDWRHLCCGMKAPFCPTSFGPMIIKRLSTWVCVLMPVSQ